MKKKLEYNKTVHQSIHRPRKAYGSEGGGEMYNIPIVFGVPMTYVRLIIWCLKEIYYKVQIGKLRLTIFIYKMVYNKEGENSSSLMWRQGSPIRTDVSEECVTSILGYKNRQLETTLA
jgi:hypothetical protein